MPVRWCHKGLSLNHIALFRAIKRLYSSDSHDEGDERLKIKNAACVTKDKKTEICPLPRGIANKSIGVNDNRIVIHEN